MGLFLVSFAFVLILLVIPVIGTHLLEEELAEDE